VSLLYLIYILICSLSFAAMDLLRKLLAGSIAPLVVVFYLSLGTVPAMAVWLAVEGDVSVSAGYLLPGLAAVVLNLVANVVFVYSVKISPLSRTIPLLSLTPVFTSLLAIPLLGEYPSPRQFVGIALVVTGAMILNLDQAGESSVKAFLAALAREKGSVLMTGVALCWSLAGALDKIALGQASAPFHGTVMCSGVALGALVVLMGRGGGKELLTIRRAPRLVIGMMIFASLALAFQLLSIQFVMISLVETLKRAIGCFMAIVLGRIVFGESISFHKLVSISIMVAGVALILV
jgi:drug/metabolite transporter (DMT)-like permease